MGHYAIYFSWKPRAMQLTPVAHQRAMRLIEKIEAAGHGPLRCYTGRGEAVATQLSRNPAVESVTVIWITENALGVWRKGRKS